MVKVVNNKILHTEIEIQTQIMRYLNCLPSIVPAFWRQNTGGAYFKGKGGKNQFVRFGKKGISDILGIMNDGKFLAIEVKRPGAKPTIHQKHFLNEIHKAKGISIVATSIEDVNMRLQMEGYLK